MRKSLNAEIAYVADLGLSKWLNADNDPPAKTTWAMIAPAHPVESADIPSSTASAEFSEMSLIEIRV
jgi:hypothetical protein